MADFRREPDWDQGAHRHSVLVDPVVTVRQLARFDYRKSYSRIDNALVFATNKGEHDTYLPPRRPSRSELATRRYTAVYEVDMGVHSCTGSLSLPSDNDAFDFTADLAMTWQVTRPEQFVTSRERDVPALLTRRLEELMREVSRRFPIDRSSEAEGAVRQAVAAAGPLAEGAGLRVSWAVRLRQDDDAVAQQRALREIRYSDQRLGSSHDLAMREDELRAERERAQADQRHELAIRQSHQEAELRKLEAEKIEYYQYYLQHGGVASWALHLSRHPEDFRLVMENLREDELTLIRSQREVALQVLKGEGNLEDYQRAGLTAPATRIVEELLTRGLPDTEPAPPVPVQGALPWQPAGDTRASFRKPPGTAQADDAGDGR
ncbi:PE-PGRS family protein [Actinacidiphila yeochonensis]|uniref:PE-PGRS family protein n=1 Tax=Actinacidiphila yeochonensis TaxID=89050 RepID=UPI00055ED7B3|nr:PE-PGRS family protein [Actinacidiphila yeochonensis]